MQLSNIQMHHPSLHTHFHLIVPHQIQTKEPLKPHTRRSKKRLSNKLRMRSAKRPRSNSVDLRRSNGNTKQRSKRSKRQLRRCARGQAVARAVEDHPRRGEHHRLREGVHEQSHDPILQTATRVLDDDHDLRPLSEGPLERRDPLHLSHLIVEVHALDPPRIRRASLLVLPQAANKRFHLAQLVAAQEVAREVDAPLPLSELVRMQYT
mmetsp:Transcript_11690/g.43962  ORF Transcript_11690/g.43962 Transcript_11690/m.43962 type:complete len:208 (-) Transcript_11690:2636-3259(-)